MNPPPGCPFHTPQSLPTDGTPLTPSPTIAAWRDAAAAVPLAYDDGHEGLVVTRYDAARAILGDPRFSQRPHRIPTAEQPAPADLPVTADLLADRAAALRDTVDDDAHASIEAANLLALDGEQHARMRRAITPRFSVKQARNRRPWVAAIVTEQLQHLVARPRPADLFEHYAEPIANRTHAAVIGVPQALFPQFVERFARPSTTQAKFDHIRAVLDARADDPGEDVVTDLLAGVSAGTFTRIEIEGLVFQLMSAGRDSVAYLIVTAMVGLLTHPEQLAALRADPTSIGSATEEFMRTGAMFLTLFPRTATEDVEIPPGPDGADSVHVRAGQTVSVSPVGANRDPRRFDRPDEFDIGRDAFGHLGFGHGPHGCVGQQLARVEIGEAVTRLVTSLPGLRLVEATQTEPLPFANPIATYAAGAVRVDWGIPSSIPR